MQKNYFTSAWIILLLAAGLISLYPWVYRQVPFLQQHTKTYVGIERLWESPTDSAAVDSIPIDSSLLAGGDTTVSDSPLAEEPLITLTNSTYLPLIRFFQQLADTSAQVRIGYFGDSSIEGDLITQTLRESLQLQFGGEGVGYLAPVVEAPGFRRSVFHSFSGDWVTGPVSKASPKGEPVGLDAHWYTIARKMVPEPEIADSIQEVQDGLPAPDPKVLPWVRYVGSKSYKTSVSFPTVRFFYGPPPPGETGGVAYATVLGDTRSYALDGTGAVNEVLFSPRSCTKMEYWVDIPSGQGIFGVSMESERGVLVDNFSMRSSSGNHLLRLPASRLQAFQEKLDYDLIVLQFGLNLVYHKRRNYDGYKQDLVKIIRHLKAGFPGVPILIIGVSDKGTKIDGIMRTDPSVPYLNQAQQDAAEEEQVGFFSLFEAMGGRGTMVKWVEQEVPPLANTDYAHFNFRGGRRVSNLILGYLEEGFRDFLEASQAQELPHPQIGSSQ